MEPRGELLGTSQRAFWSESWPSRRSFPYSRWCGCSAFMHALYLQAGELLTCVCWPHHVMYTRSHLPHCPLAVSSFCLLPRRAGALLPAGHSPG